MENEVLDADSILEEGLNLVPASKGKRFANFLIDYVVIILIYTGLVIVGAITIPEEGDVSVDILDRLVSILIYVSYYVLVEGGLRGKTIGKLITNTRVVDYHGNAPDFGTVLKRSFSRIVPFEAFSFLGSQPDGWHDRWSDTMVMDVSKSTFIEDLH